MAKDVCDCLELTEVSKTVSYLDEDERTTITNRRLTKSPNGIIILVSEPGLYSLIPRSRKPEAKLFKRWVTHEVLPAIRKHGMYATPTTVDAMLSDPETAIKMLTAFKHWSNRR